jgi:hypothetical protein
VKAVVTNAVVCPSMSSSSVAVDLHPLVHCNNDLTQQFNVDQIVLFTCSADSRDIMSNSCQQNDDEAKPEDRASKSWNMVQNCFIYDTAILQDCHRLLKWGLSFCEIISVYIGKHIQHFLPFPKTAVREIRPKLMWAIILKYMQLKWDCLRFQLTEVSTL